jgi:hypothetical protein
MDAEETARLHDEILQLTLEVRDAIGDGHLDRLRSLLARRETLIASLPAKRGESAVGHKLRQIAELDEASETLLRAWRERVVAELDLLRRGRIGLNGYRTRTRVSSSFLDNVS